MKSILLFFSFSLIYLLAFSQSPEKVNYQGVARDANGIELANQTIGLRLSIRQGGNNGTVVYQESHSPFTSQFGLFNIEIGGGSVISGTFNTIDWGVGPYFFQVEMDVNGGTSYTDMGTMQFISVPFALYAKKAGALDGIQVGQQGPAGPTGPQGPAGTGLNNQGNWVSGTTYNPNDYVFAPSSSNPSVNSMWVVQSGSPFVSGTDPANDPTNWVEFEAPQGPTGVTGPTGANGLSGVTGATGANGLNGTNGTTGATGPTGADGINGNNGATGATGPSGIDGSNGLMGATGPVGPTGVAGNNGTTGPSGADGINGNNGATGATGPSGIDGSNGLTGATGPAGPTGVAGNNGATGPSGADGLNGNNGATGATGPSGIDGSNGLTGATGPAGPTGAAGAAGATGATGSNGANGSTGPAGPTGSAGANGSTGPAGPTGVAGTAGATGATGNNGSTGPAGPSGTDGATGPAGPTGTANVSGTLNYISKFTPDGSTLGNSQIFDNATNVGIGTNVPAEKLHITGNIIIPHTNSYYTYNGFSQKVPLVSALNDDIYFGKTGSNYYYSTHIVSGIGPLASISLDNNSGTSMVYVHGNTGNVGLGSTSPVEKLDVSGSVVIPHASVYYTYNGFNQKVPLVSALNDDIYLGKTGSNYYYSTHIVSGIGPLASVSLDNNSGTSMLYASSNSGNVGINSTAPGAKLDVNGTVMLGANGTALTAVIKGTGTTTSLSIATQTTSTQTYAIANAAVGASVMVSPASALAAGLVIAYARVSAAGTVEVSYRNTTAGSVTLAAGTTLYITVVQ